MPGIFLTTNVFAHVGGLFFPLSFTRKKAWQRKRTVAAAYARLDRRFLEKSFAKTSISLPDVWKFSFFGVHGSALTGCRPLQGLRPRTPADCKRLDVLRKVWVSSLQAVVCRQSEPITV